MNGVRARIGRQADPRIATVAVAQDAEAVAAEVGVDGSIITRNGLDLESSGGSSNRTKRLEGAKIAVASTVTKTTAGKTGTTGDSFSDTVNETENDIHTMRTKPHGTIGNSLAEAANEWEQDVEKIQGYPRTPRDYNDGYDYAPTPRDDDDYAPQRSPPRSLTALLYDSGYPKTPQKSRTTLPIFQRLVSRFFK